MHGKLEKLLVILTIFPAILIHFLLEIIQGILQQGTGIDVRKRTTLLLSQFLQLWGNLPWYLSGLTQDHSPHIVIHVDIPSFPLLQRKEVHQRDVLHILAERGHQWWIAHTRPHISHLSEELDEQVIRRQLWLTFLLAKVIDGPPDTSQVSHHRPHHSPWKTAGQQEGAHELILRIDEIAQPVIDKLLCQGTCLHISVHVDLRDIKASMLQHALYGNHVRVHLTPRQWLNGCVNDIRAIVAHFQDACH